MIKENETYNKLNFKDNVFASEYDCCKFVDCNFESTVFNNITFMECEFINCNLSNVKINVSAFKDVIFKNCKLIGINFNDSNPFLLQLQFNDCDLTLASFYQLEIKKTFFTNCNLSEVDFTETNLTESVFNNCNLSRAIFDNTTLEKVNLQSAENFSINPEKNKVKKAVFSKTNIQGLLNHLDVFIK